MTKKQARRVLRIFYGRYYREVGIFCPVRLEVEACRVMGGLEKAQVYIRKIVREGMRKAGTKE